MRDPVRCRFRPSLEIMERRDQPSLFGTNLIVNGNGEANIGSAKGSDIIRPITGWTPTGQITVVKYGAGSTYPSSLQFGGKNFFAGGPNNAASSMAQNIKFSTSDGKIIDQGGVTYRLTGAFGGYYNQNDSATLTATFKSSGGQVLGKATVGGVTAKDRSNKTTLLTRAGSDFLPVGTRTVQLVVNMARTGYNYNNGYADNLSLVLANTTKSHVQLSAPTYNASESQTTLTLTVTRVGFIGGPASMLVNTSNGTAAAKSDYTALTNFSLKFAAGQKSKTFTIKIANDKVHESSETFYVKLSKPVGSQISLGTPDHARITIKDND